MLKLLTLILVLQAPLISWGFSFERTEEYKKQAVQQGLYQVPNWLKLGHYRAGWGGHYHSPIRGNFFLAEDGAENPEHELAKTIDVLFSEKTSQQQCRYLARTSWLKKTLHIAFEDLVACPERDVWKKQLGATEAYIVFAASDLSSAASSFGHTFLRLHNPKNTKQLELLDYGVNYAAITGKDGGAIYALKGLFGFYPGSYSMLPYHQKIQEYSNLEGRDLWEYKLALNPEEVELLVNHLLELDASYAPYYFSDENCSEQMLELIEVARPDQQLISQFHDIVLPLDTVKVLNEKHMLVDEKSRMSLQTEWLARHASLSLVERNALKKVLNSTYAQDSSYLDLSNKEKAETLEAALSYLAIQEYRDGTERKDQKYKISVARAHLGSITEPVAIASPKSPLASPDTQAYYLGYGQDQHVDYYSLKYRRGFHDLLSDDSSLAPFSQLDFMSFDFRYKPSEENLDLYQWVALSMLSTSPWNELDHPLSWKLEFGTRPKFVPYLDGGVGLSLDFPLLRATRWTLFAVSENEQLTETANPHLGGESLIMMKWAEHFRSVITNKYLYSTSRGQAFWDNSFGVSFDHGSIEFRLEGQHRDDKDSWQFTIVL